MRLKTTRRQILVKGFRFSGVASGIKGGRRLDLALVVSDIPAVSAAAFTTSRTAAPPVLLGRRLMRGRYLQALVVNSGNANAGTGRRGRVAAERTCKQAATVLGIPRQLVLPASTGKIGAALPDLGMGIAEAAAKLSPRGFWRAASAILTTDAFPKVGLRQLRIAGRDVTIAAMAKGAGMIAPRMATLLAFFLTDAALTPGAARRLVDRGIVPVFNRVTVEGDTSTNDTTLIMANGMAGSPPMGVSSPFFQEFLASVREITRELATLVVTDGEGATRVIEILVRGAGSKRDAEMVGRAVAESVLVKAAVFGGDPNWGRVLAAVGKSGARVDPDRLTISIGGVRLLRRGLPAGEVAQRKARQGTQRKRVQISVDLGLHRGRKGDSRQASFLTCDLSLGYLRFNSAYST